MELIKQLNEALELEVQELNEEVAAYVDNCIFILESSAHVTCDSAVCFLTHLAADVKAQSLHMDKKAKHKFAILAALSLLRKKQTIADPTADSPSLRKYMHSEPDTSTDDLDEVQKVLTRVLSKLKSEHNESGTKYKEHLISLYSSAPDSLLDTIVKLKRRYQQMKTKL